MQAIICDRCGAMWIDKAECKVYVSKIILTKGNSHSDKIADYDLCEECKDGLFEYLKPIKINEL